jgi:PilZ domain
MNEPDPASSPERRNIIRFPSSPQLKVLCRMDRQQVGPPLAVDALDLSRTGIRIFLKEPLVPAQVVRLELTSSDLHEPLVCLGKVAWALELAAHGYYCAGVQFDQPLHEEQLKQLVVVPD